MKYIIFKIVLFSLFFISEAKSDVPGISIPYYKTSALTEFENHDWTDRTTPADMTPEELHELDVKFRNLPESLRKPAGIAETYSVGDTNLFWIEKSSSNNQWRQITAECRKVTTEAYVFVVLADIDDNPVYYDGSNEGYITQDDINSIADEFSDIYETDRRVFGNEPEKGVNGDSHVTILLFDIDDSYAGGYSGGKYIGGYFYDIDTFNESLAQQYGYHSNECKIIYIDTYPGIEKSPKPDTVHDVSNVYRVLAHEFQHLIHFSFDSDEELWVDEGCASLAEYVCGYGLREPYHFSKAPDDPLTDWNGELLDYEQVALFFLYLYENYGGEVTIKELVAYTKNSIDGINDVLASHGYSERFYDIFDDWGIANYLDDTSIYEGLYGYQGIDLSDYPFKHTYTHSIYHVSESGSVSKNAVEYILFTQGFPLTLFYEPGYELNGYVVAKGSGSASITVLPGDGVDFPDFGDTVSQLVLVANAHDDSNSYSYYTTDIAPAPPEPPYDLQVSDIPDDNGYSLILTWNLSPDDDLLSHYAIYRSRNPELTEAVPLESFDTLEDLKAAEQEQTILIDTVNAGESAYTDTFVPLNGVTYYYWVQAVSETGASKLAPLDNDPVKVSVSSVPGRFSLTGNFPNPFNASTSIQFETPVPCNVKLDIFSVSGQYVTTLMDNPVSPGIHSFVWEPGNIAAGIYLYSLKAGGKRFVGKMVFLK